MLNCSPSSRVDSPTLKLYNSIESVPQITNMPREQRELLQAVTRIFPFRVNGYILEQLIDWSSVPNDPIFRLLFPDPQMLDPHDLREAHELITGKVSTSESIATISRIRKRYNPHPDGQLELNTPLIDHRPSLGIQHKYAQTVLYFPSHGQTCHSYCAYCFRWAQFLRDDGPYFSSPNVDELVRYLYEHPEVKSVLFTGGDPLIMSADVLERCIGPLLAPQLEHIEIRIGTKAIAFWPQRFVTDKDADQLLRLFERIVAHKRHLAIMFHQSHPRELQTEIAQLAIQRIRGTGAVIRSQAPVVRHVNDDPDTWATMWDQQVRLGIVPYYFFVSRDTGPRAYYEVPLARAFDIYRHAQMRVSGLARTARGPSMSAEPGKVTIDGIIDVAEQRCFVLRFLQARDPDWVGRPFLARFDAQAAWLSNLRPVGDGAFFYEAAMHSLKQERARQLKEAH